MKYIVFLTFLFLPFTAKASDYHREFREWHYYHPHRDHPSYYTYHRYPEWFYHDREWCKHRPC